MRWALFDAADEQRPRPFLEEGRELERVGVVDDDGALVAQLAQFLVIFAQPGLRTYHEGIHAQLAQRPQRGKRL